MAYDLLVKNGRIIDGSGMPAFHGDVAVVQGKIAELGRLSGSARRIIDADGLAVTPWLHRQPLPLRCPSHLGCALYVLLLPWGDHCHHRQLFVNAGPR
jgi:hypothetical protein